MGVLSSQAWGALFTSMGVLSSQAWGCSLHKHGVALFTSMGCSLHSGGSGDVKSYSDIAKLKQLTGTRDMHLCRGVAVMWSN